MADSKKLSPKNELPARRQVIGSRKRRSTAAVQALCVVRNGPAVAKRLECGDFSPAVVPAASRVLA